jgi:hypothetical protein
MADLLDTDENRPAAANSQFVELQRYKYLPINHFTCFTCNMFAKKNQRNNGKQTVVTAVTLPGVPLRAMQGLARIESF